SAGKKKNNRSSTGRIGTKTKQHNVFAHPPGANRGCLTGSPSVLFLYALCCTSPNGIKPHFTSCRQPSVMLTDCELTPEGSRSGRIPRMCPIATPLQGILTKRFPHPIEKLR